MIMMLECAMLLDELWYVQEHWKQSVGLVE